MVDDGVHRYWERINLARSDGADAAAAMARRVPGRAGIVLFRASRADGPDDIAAWSGIPVEQVDAILREAQERDALATQSHE